MMKSKNILFVSLIAIFAGVPAFADIASTTYVSGEVATITAALGTAAYANANGAVASGNTGLVTGGTVYNAIGDLGTHIVDGQPVAYDDVKDYVDTKVSGVENSVNSLGQSVSGNFANLQSGKQNVLGGSGHNGEVVTATGAAGSVTYTAIDSAPTSASTNLVQSGGVYTALADKQDKQIGAAPGEGNSADAGKAVIVNNNGQMGLSDNVLGSAAYAAAGGAVASGNTGLVTGGTVYTAVDAKIDKTVVGDAQGVLVRNDAGLAMKGTGTDISVSAAGAITVTHATSADSATNATNATNATTATNARNIPSGSANSNTFASIWVQ